MPRRDGTPPARRYGEDLATADGDRGGPSPGDGVAPTPGLAGPSSASGSHGGPPTPNPPLHARTSGVLGPQPPTAGSRIRAPDGSRWAPAPPRHRPRGRLFHARRTPPPSSPAYLSVTPRGPGLDRPGLDRLASASWRRWRSRKRRALEPSEDPHGGGPEHHAPQHQTPPTGRASVRVDPEHPVQQLGPRDSLRLYLDLHRTRQLLLPTRLVPRRAILGRHRDHLSPPRRVGRQDASIEDHVWEVDAVDRRIREPRCRTTKGRAPP